ncbi:MAG TPA: 3-oxoacyl-[acyl-carrier-protein] reductase [Ktedonobacterales bacterium]|nr:3-oxoacyl-[acyl-carrier-protein] reductase [Ktedonobacterales bacterium]
MADQQHAQSEAGSAPANEPLLGRLALVTGSSRGIGQATALRLARLGADVAVNYRTDEAGATETQRLIRALGRRADIFAADASVEADVARLFSEVEARLGSVAILVNNAGTTHDRLLLQMTLEQFDHVLRTNLHSAFLCTRAALRSMLRARWGRVVNVASISGLLGQAGQANYAASKAGLIALTKSVAREVGSRGITVNAVAPGFVPTELTSQVPQNLRDYMLGLTALGRFGEADEIAAVIAFLCTPDAGYITGQTLAVDGGISMH